MLQRPKLLILDEAFSNIDEPASFKILQSLKLEYPDMAVVMITHFSKHFEFADEIINVGK